MACFLKFNVIVQVAKSNSLELCGNCLRPGSKKYVPRGDLLPTGTQENYQLRTTLKGVGHKGSMNSSPKPALVQPMFGNFQG